MHCAKKAATFTRPYTSPNGAQSALLRDYRVCRLIGVNGSSLRRRRDRGLGVPSEALRVELALSEEVYVECRKDLEL